MPCQLPKVHLAVRNVNFRNSTRTQSIVLKGRIQVILDGVFTMTPELNTLLLAQVDGLTQIVDDLRIFGFFNAGTLELSLASVDLSGCGARRGRALCCRAHRSGRYGATYAYAGSRLG